MIKKFLQKAAAFVLCTVCFLAFAPDAAAAQLQGLPGQELWQPYLEKAPQSAESFVKDPLKSLLALLPGSPAEMIRQMAHCYADVLLFLLLLIVLSFLVGGAADSALLELAAAVGCGTLLWGDLISLAQLICERMEGWKNYLLGFLPVYSGVLAAGGEVNASTAANGLLLTGLCFLAQGTVLVVSPLLQSYLAVSMACCISTQQGLSETCRVMGALLRRGLVWAGRIFAVLLGLQRSGNGSAGPFCTAVGPAAYRRRAGDRAGSERYGRSISCRNAAAQKQSGFCGTCRDRGRISATVSAASAPFAIPCRMQASVRPCGEPALSGAV